MADPFKADGPTLVSVSGGRTSGYMLRRVLDAHGRLPGDVHVVFANTGLEMPATLDFVRDLGERWGVAVRWVEYCLTEEDRPTWREVDYASASRAGEPFGLYLDHIERETASKGNPPYLPGPGARFCTTELKVRVMKKLMLSMGYRYWTNVVGIRFDEPKRWRKMNLTPPERWEISLPLVQARVDVEEVRGFWRSQPFDLQLAGDWEGNCDACHLKMPWKVARVFRDYPERAGWWLERERRAGKLFRPSGPSIEQLVDMSKLPIIEGDDEYEVKCTGCTD